MPPSPKRASSNRRTNAKTKPTYHSVNIDGLDVFYREAGNPADPTLLLLHGFPTSSHMFRDLIPLLSDRFHVVAPDLPGFGRTTLPSRDKFTYTFENLAKVISHFTEVIGLDRFALYIFDYGAPTGLRTRWAIRNGSLASFRRMETLMKKVSATAGIPSSAIGEILRIQIARRSESY